MSTVKDTDRFPNSDLLGVLFCLKGIALALSILGLILVLLTTIGVPWQACSWCLNTTSALLWFHVLFSDMRK